MRRGASYGMSCDDISLDVITISSWLSADEAKRERRSDVVLRFSRWINVDDVIGDVIQSQESVGSLHSRRKRKRRRRGDPVASYSAISRCYLKISNCKTMSFT
ncbi:nuclear transcription factor Y subunit C-1 [Dorcoceras hygrometricum]|uniref:Nuclear transcription factor Y subunit C-1 n=1 Tax=Dorcoceras hygrometricum TaxID=472368 RepID=A0A2Z6ZW33_9LAMI|nr:nuclear transcription factor Y subunit C-1 [Dorcoceras hygrometricum]